MAGKGRCAVECYSIIQAIPHDFRQRALGGKVRKVGVNKWADAGRSAVSGIATKAAAQRSRLANLGALGGAKGAVASAITESAFDALFPVEDTLHVPIVRGASRMELMICADGTWHSKVSNPPPDRKPHFPETKRKIGSRDAFVITQMGGRGTIGSVGAPGAGNGDAIVHTQFTPTVAPPSP